LDISGTLVVRGLLLLVLRKELIVKVNQLSSCLI
jgi:hypothetical protein